MLKNLIVCMISCISNTFILILYIIRCKVKMIQHSVYFLFFTVVFDYFNHIYAYETQIQISSFLKSSSPVFTKCMLNF